MHFVGKKHILLIFYDTCHICFPSINNADTAAPNLLLNCIYTFFSTTAPQFNSICIFHCNSGTIQNFFYHFSQIPSFMASFVFANGNKSGTLFHYLWGWQTSLFDFLRLLLVIQPILLEKGNRRRSSLTLSKRSI